MALKTREVRVGFSGGELKRWDLAKLLLQHPAVLLLDEPDSGVDLEHVSAIGDAIDHLLQLPNERGVETSALIVSHTSSILKRLHVDVGHLIVDGHLIYSGDPNKLIAHIEANDYSSPDENPTAKEKEKEKESIMTISTEPTVTTEPAVTTDQRELLETVGYDDLNRAGTSLIAHHEVVSAISQHPDVEILSLRDALQKYL